MTIDVWLIIGLLAQGIFGARFLIQWICSERKKQSYIPLIFWYVSILGGLMLLCYAIHRRDPVFILGQSMGVMVYTRNLILIYKNNRNVSLF